MKYTLTAQERIYACIDLKCFYASVECVERGLDPFQVNLVVADPARGRGAICLAISPALKALGVRNRCRLYEIPGYISYIIAKPRMKLYMRYSANIYQLYLQYFAQQDIYVYSVDECFVDLTPYFSLYRMQPKQIAKMLTDAVQRRFGLCSAAGIGTNIFLAKIALDILAKHMPDKIAYLDEASFKLQLWHHRPLTDFWNIGKGIAKRLARYGLYDLYGVAHFEPKLLYKEFGVNAEYLLDHAWGRESCTIEEINNYRVKEHSISTSQVLFKDYQYADALVVLLEMAELLSLELVKKNLVCSAIGLTVKYSKDCRAATGGTRRLAQQTASYSLLTDNFKQLYLETVDKSAPIRKLSVSAGRLVRLWDVEQSLFADDAVEVKDRQVQKAVLNIKERFGKSMLMRGRSYQDKATGFLRNKLVGGHNGE